MADTGGWENVILPSAFASPGEAIQARINNRNALFGRNAQLMQNDEEMRQRELDRKQKEQEQYGLTNLANLNRNTDADKLLLGDKYANDVTQKQLQQTYQDLITKVGSTDPITFDYMLHNKVDEVNNWHGKFKTDLEYSKQRIDDILKDNPNLDANQAKEAARSEIDNKYFKQDENGEYVRKSPEEVDANKDPTAIFNDPKFLGNIAVGGGDIIKGMVQAGKLHQEDYSTYASNKGFVNSKDYNIGRSDLQELSHDQNGEPVLKLKTEDLNLGNGVNLKMIPEDTFKAYMDNPVFKSAFYKLWNPVAAKIEQSFASKGQAIDPHSEQMLQRDFLRKYIEDNNIDLSYVQTKEKNVIPKPSISFNFGAQARQDASALIDGITGAVRAGDETQLKQLTSYFKRGNTPFKLEEAFFVPGSDKKKLALQYYIVDGKGKRHLQEKYFDADDPYLRDKIIAEYQQDMGSTVPVEQLPYQNYLPNVQVSGTGSGQQPKPTSDNKWDKYKRK